MYFDGSFIIHCLFQFYFSEIHFACQLTLFFVIFWLEWTVTVWKAWMSGLELSAELTIDAAWGVLPNMCWSSSSLRLGVAREVLLSSSSLHAWFTSLPRPPRRLHSVRLHRTAVKAVPLFLMLSPAVVKIAVRISMQWFGSRPILIFVLLRRVNYDVCFGELLIWSIVNVCLKQTSSTKNFSGTWRKAAHLSRFFIETRQHVTWQRPIVLSSLCTTSSAVEPSNRHSCGDNSDKNFNFSFIYCRIIYRSLRQFFPLMRLPFLCTIKSCL